MIMVDVIIGVTKNHLSSGSGVYNNAFMNTKSSATKSACGHWFLCLDLQRRPLEAVTCLKCQRTKLYKLFEEADKE